jgi:hypothetical protein
MMDQAGKNMLLARRETFKKKMICHNLAKEHACLPPIEIGNVDI